MSVVQILLFYLPVMPARKNYECDQCSNDWNTIELLDHIPQADAPHSRNTKNNRQSERGSADGLLAGIDTTVRRSRSRIV